MTNRRARRQIFLPTTVHVPEREGEERQHDRDAEIERMIKQADDDANRPPIEISQLPMQPMFWHVLLEPARARSTIGSGVLYAAELSQQIEDIQTTIGRIVAIGPSAFTGKTNAGNFLGEDIDRSTIVGKWVMFAKHTGQEIRLRSGHRLKLMNDSELLAFVNDPEDFKHWL
jgi:co-chaperonin GroES (HSP10)